MNTHHKKAYVAGGCFWGMQELLRKEPGVLSTRVGYCGGDNENPTYTNHPGHAEAVEIVYDAQETNFIKLLDFFFRIHNPTTLNRQGNDIGSSYRSTIFYQNEEEKKLAEDFMRRVDASSVWKDPAQTTLEPFMHFWQAEEYHQDYLQKNPEGYTCHAVWFDTLL